MIDHAAIRLVTATLSLTVPAAGFGDDEPGTPTSPDIATIVETPLSAAAAHLRSIDAFEVVVATIVRDREGRRLAPPSRGRVAFDRSGESTRFLVETWGGLGSARLACDGETVTMGEPSTRTFESRPLPENPALLLDDEEVVVRFGPAAIHVLGLVLQDGLSAFRQIGDARTVDLGPHRADLVPCRSMLDEAGGEVRMAFAADGPPLPLAVAVMLPDGCVVELEFHDWMIGRVEEGEATFAPPTSSWRAVTSLPRPACLPPIESPIDPAIDAAMPVEPTAVAEVVSLED